MTNEKSFMLLFNELRRLGLLRIFFQTNQRAGRNKANALLKGKTLLENIEIKQDFQLFCRNISKYHTYVHFQEEILMRKYAKFIVMCVGLFYAWCAYKYFTISVKTDIVRYGTIEDIESTVGYVIREEELVYSNSAGTFYSVVDEGERVAKGARIATIYKGQIDQKIQDRIASLNNRIAEINNNQIQKDIFAGDLYKLELQIDSKVKEIIEISHNHKASKLSQLKSDVNLILDKKLAVSGEKGPAGNNLEALRKEKESLERQLNASKEDIYAQKSGVFSYHLDGLEQILVPANINQMLPSHFDAIKNVQVQNSNTAEPGKAVAKIINNFEWYLAVVLDKDEVEPLKAGDVIDIGFPDSLDYRIDASVYYISPSENGKVLIVFLINKEVDLPYTSREVNVEIVKQSYSGFKIPASALRVRDGKRGVYVIRDSIARFKEIEIIYNNNEFIIAKENNTKEDGLLLYDQVIVKSNNISEGDLVR